MTANNTAAAYRSESRPEANAQHSARSTQHSARAESVLVLGATSGIARALALRLAARGCRLVLAGRNREELDRQAADLRLRHGIEVAVELFDALDFASHVNVFNRCVAAWGGRLDGVVLCHGHLADQRQTETDVEAARRMIDVNFTSAVSLLSAAANHFERQRSGFIAAISSVAGDRGRQSNYTYGAAKAGLTAYLQGLRNRLHRSNVTVLTIKPGFVNPNSPLLASPERVARDIDRAIRRRRDVLYTPWFWSPILRIIRMIPECVFKRMKL
jgi:NAD(P)-dependent dehydrogenase (short-subunit alcohol dehydrogenase family)